MKLSGVRRIVNRITYKPGTEVVAHEPVKGVICVYVAANVYDSRTLGPSEFRGRDFALASDAKTDEIIKSAFLALKTFEEHELMEFFKYKGKTVFDPHRRIA